MVCRFLNALSKLNKITLVYIEKPFRHWWKGFYFLLPSLLIINIITATTNAISSMPDQTPALKMPPITSQPGKIVIIITSRNAE
jgi:hypothetical protein